MTASAAIYYVNQQAVNDSGPGDMTNPFKTIGKALAQHDTDWINLRSDYTTAAGEDITIPNGVTLSLGGSTLTISEGTTLTNGGNLDVFNATLIVSGGLVNNSQIYSSGSPFYLTVNGVLINRGNLDTSGSLTLGANGLMYLENGATLLGGAPYIAGAYGGSGIDNIDDIDSIEFDTQGNIISPAWLGRHFTIYEIETESGSMFAPFTPGSYKLEASPTEPDEFSEMVLHGLPGSLFHRFDITLPVKPRTAVCLDKTPEAPETPETQDTFKSSSKKTPREHYGFVYYVPDGEGGWKIWGADFGHSRGDYTVITDRAPRGLLYWSPDERGLSPLRYKPGDRRLIAGDSSLYAIVKTPRD